MKAYINHPNPHITIHRNPACPQIQKHQKESQRTVTVTAQNIGYVLTDFIQGKYRFAADSAHNDLWLEISLSSSKREESLVYVVQAILSLKYRPFERAPVNKHPCQGS